MNCSLSGELCEDPVVSPTGHIFERRLIEKYIKENDQKCPITGQELSLDNLISIKNINQPIKPRPASATSLASLLKLFQNEWDAVMLETYTLKQHLEKVRQELSHSLYQHDAACRVIARLIQERDEARQALADTQKNIESTISSVVTANQAEFQKSLDDGTKEMKEDANETGISNEIVTQMQAHAKKLSRARKKRQKMVHKDLASIEQIRKYQVVESHSLHQPSSSALDLGIMAMDLHPVKQNFIATGGIDFSVVVWDRETQQVEARLEEHSDRVSGVVWHSSQDLLLSVSYDKSSIIWRKVDTDDSPYKIMHRDEKTHTDRITGVSIHATGDYFVTSSLDSSWAFYDIRTGMCKRKISSNETSNQKEKIGFADIMFHPDGLILGTAGNDSIVRIQDVKKQKNVAQLEGYEGSVTALAFSENGYHLATSDERGIVKLWDLRKLENFQNISVPAGVVRSLQFDWTGNYLAIGGKSVQVYSCKDQSLVNTFDDHISEVTSIRFGSDAKFITTSSFDGTVKFYEEKS